MRLPWTRTWPGGTGSGPVIGSFLAHATRRTSHRDARQAAARRRGFELQRKPARGPRFENHIGSLPLSGESVGALRAQKPRLMPKTAWRIESSTFVVPPGTSGARIGDSNRKGCRLV